MRTDVDRNGSSWVPVRTERPDGQDPFPRGPSVRPSAGENLSTFFTLYVQDRARRGLLRAKRSEFMKRHVNLELGNRSKQIATSKISLSGSPSAFEDGRLNELSSHVECGVQ